MRRPKGARLHPSFLLRQPLETADASETAPLPGAVIPWWQIPDQTEPTAGAIFESPTFDLVSILAAPADGTELTLVGPVLPDQTAALSPQSSLGRIPRGYRAIVDGIFPYLEASSGPIAGPRIPGPGVSIVWSVRVDGAPVGSYGRISTIITPWNGQSDRALFGIRPGAELSCTCSFNDALGLYSYVGVRIKGRMVPLDKYMVSEPLT